MQSTKPITRRQILDSSKLKEFANDNFKFDENGRELTKRIENTVGKGEIDCYEYGFGKKNCVSTGVRKPGNTDRHDMTLAVKVALNPNTTNQPFLKFN